MTLRFPIHYALLFIPNWTFLFPFVLIIFHEIYVQTISALLCSWSVWFITLSFYMERYYTKHSEWIKLNLIWNLKWHLYIYKRYFNYTIINFFQANIWIDKYHHFLFQCINLCKWTFVCVFKNIIVYQLIFFSVFIRFFTWTNIFFIETRTVNVLHVYQHLFSGFFSSSKSKKLYET